MSLTVSAEVLKATSHEQLAKDRKAASDSRVEREVYIKTERLDAAALKDLAAAAAGAGDGKTSRAVESILAARDGDFSKPVPSFKAFLEVLQGYLLQDHIDGWIYATGDDGRLYPKLVTSVTYDDGNAYGRGKGDPSIKLHVISYGFSRDGNYKVMFGQNTSSYSFSPNEGKAPCSRHLGGLRPVQRDTRAEGGVPFNVGASPTGCDRSLCQAVQSDWQGVSLRRGKLAASWSGPVWAACHSRS